MSSQIDAACLAADAAAKDPIYEGCQGELRRGFGVQSAQAAFVHGVQQGYQILVRIFLPTQPKPAQRREELSGGASAFRRETRSRQSMRIFCMLRTACQCNYDIT